MYKQTIQIPIERERALTPTSLYTDLRCDKYPWIQIEPCEFCKAVNDLLKIEAGRYCEGLMQIAMYYLQEERDKDQFFRALTYNGLIEYSGIGKKTASFILSLVERGSECIPIGLPFTLLHSISQVGCRDEDKPRNFPWLLTIDTRSQAGHEVARRLYPYDEVTYRHRLKIEKGAGCWNIRYLVDDINENCFAGGM